jgi:hypothetical protein
MTYIEAWQEGHAAGIACLIKAINQACGTEFESTTDLILHIRHMQSPIIEEGLTKRDKENNQDLARRIAQQNWLWSDL